MHTVITAHCLQKEGSSRTCDKFLHVHAAASPTSKKSSRPPAHNRRTAMRRLAHLAGAATLLVAGQFALVAAPASVALIPVDGEGAGYWTRWRGPSGQGAVAGTNYVDTWSDTTNVKWKVAVPGRGHSSPIVWKDHIFLTTARDDGTKVSMLAFRRSDGALLWETSVPATDVEYVYQKNSHASATPATDGRRVYASLGTHGLAAFDFDGKIVWHRKLGDLRNYHGSAGSPVLYKDRVFIYQDHDGSSTLGSFVAAFNAQSGAGVWRKDRVESVGWGTAIVINAGGRDELIVSGHRKEFAHHPRTGAEIFADRAHQLVENTTPVVG